VERITKLTNTTQIAVRFSEVDSLGIVWHGHYLKYFEDGREAFGLQYGLGYMDVYSNGFVIPIVKMEVDYKRPLNYGEKATIETTYWDSEAAKLIFTYVLKNSASHVVATARSIQVFMQKEELSLNVPDFMVDWKRRNL